MWAAIEFESFELNKKIIRMCLDRGIITDWFLFAPECMRVAPPLSITGAELISVCQEIIIAMNEVFAEKAT